MRPINYFIICLTIAIQSCNGQTPPKKEIYNKEFNWKITIPENFENVNVQDWEKMQNKGKTAIEKTYGEEVINNAKTIFVFKSDQFNYFESNYQPYDRSKDGDYLESFKAVNEVLYNTFKTQMPGAKLDSLSSEETIDGLKFNMFKIVIDLPNKKTLDCTMFSRLFGKKELTVSIMTLDKKKQSVLFDAWKNSKFGKQ